MRRSDATITRPMLMRVVAHITHPMYQGYARARRSVEISASTNAERSRLDREP
jgi:hypothetical protein